MVPITVSGIYTRATESIEAGSTLYSIESISEDLYGHILFPLYQKVDDWITTVTPILVELSPYETYRLLLGL